MPRPKMFDVEIKTAITADDYDALQDLSRLDQVPVAHLVRSAIHYLLHRDPEPEPFPPIEEES